jgi:hypothetical protein
VSGRDHRELLLDRQTRQKEPSPMNADAIRRELKRRKPLQVVTRDQGTIRITNKSMTGLTRSYLIIEDQRGGLDVMDHEKVILLRKPRTQ